MLSKSLVATIALGGALLGGAAYTGVNSSVLPTSSLSGGPCGMQPAAGPACDDATGASCAATAQDGRSADLAAYNARVERSVAQTFAAPLPACGPRAACLGGCPVIPPAPELTQDDVANGTAAATTVAALAVTPAVELAATPLP